MGTSLKNHGSSSYNRSVIIKVLVIGDPFVGKTSFVQRYVNGSFSRHYKCSVGVDFGLKILHWTENQKLKIQLWDIAGQERFTCMTRVYYRDAEGCVIMFDLTDRSSFLNVAKWKRDFDKKCCSSLEDTATKPPCFLLANKCELKFQRQVSRVEVERMCTEYGFSGWFEISVKDNHKVQETMVFLIESIIKAKSFSNSNSSDSGSDELNRAALIKLNDETSSRKRLQNGRTPAAKADVFDSCNSCIRSIV